MCVSRKESSSSELCISSLHLYVLQQKQHHGTEVTACILYDSVLMFLFYKIQLWKNWLIYLSSDLRAFQLDLEKIKEFLYSQCCLTLAAELK